MGFQDLSWDISMSSLVMLAASTFEILWGKTDKHKNATENPTRMTAVDVDT